MSNYIISNGELYNADELMHYGVKGMKWGVTNRREYKVAKRFAKMGRRQGQADYYRKTGDAAYKKHDENARVLEKTAKQWESKGSHIKAQLARKSAEAIRARGENIRSANYATAGKYQNKADKLESKANKYASKKKVNLGKKTLDTVLNDSRSKGYERTAKAADYQREENLKNKMGASNYDRYRKIRGR